MNNRIIKFRVWGKEHLEMRYPTKFRKDKQRTPSCDIFTPNYEFNGNSYELMQFTGLTDKNGVDIYEGDIVIFNEDERLLIEWNEESACFVGIIYFENDGESWKESDFDAARSLDEFDGDEEVIGNMFENPELLTK